MMKRIDFVLFCSMICTCLIAPSFASPPVKYTNPPVHNLDKEGWNHECVDAPYATVRYFYNSLSLYPKATVLCVRWDCAAGEEVDNFYCVYDVRKSTLTTTYDGAGIDTTHTIYRLYHVTKAVLEKASREPEHTNPSRGLDCSAAFAFLRSYGARMRR